VSGSGISWDICKSAPRSRQPRQHPTTQFFTGRMPFLPPNQQWQSTEGSKHCRLVNGLICLCVWQVLTAETFWLPPVSEQLMTDSRLVPHVQSVLDRGMLRGVLLTCQDGNITAHRLCKYAPSASWNSYSQCASTIGGSLRWPFPKLKY